MSIKEANMSGMYKQEQKWECNGYGCVEYEKTKPMAEGSYESTISEH